MTPAVLADTLNLTHQIKTYGAYAGFAAIIGLAILSVLYFAQAREVKRLREWAGRGPERAAEVGARAGADANRRIVAEPIARPEPITAAAQSAPPPSKTVPPTLAAAGVAGAAGAAAVSSGDKNGDDDKPDADVAAGDEVVEAGNGAKADAAVDAEATSIVKPDDKPSDDRSAVKVPGDTEDDIGQTSVAMAPIPASARARPSASPAPARRPRAGTPPPEDDDDGHSPWPMRLLIAAAVVVLVVFVLVVISPFGGSDNKKAAATTTTTTHGTPTAVTTGAVKGGSASEAPPRKEITVGVLNGTAVPHLAKTTGQTLSGAGFTVPPLAVATANDQTHVATVVAYAPGQKSSALAVAETLGLNRDSLVKLDSDTRLVAGVPGLDVVVTVGSDRG